RPLPAPRGGVRWRHPLRRRGDRGPLHHPAAAGMTSTVLVVDDEVDLLFTIALSLELAGYRVLKAGSGEEALAVAAAESPAAIVLDLRLPGIDGWEVIRRLGETGGFPRIPVVLL